MGGPSKAAASKPHTSDISNTWGTYYNDLVECLQVSVTASALPGSLLVICNALNILYPLPQPAWGQLRPEALWTA